MNQYHKKWINIVKVIVLKHINTKKYFVFLFGSFADNSFRRDSDLDIGIYGEKCLSDFVIAKIKWEIEESIVPFKPDIIDFSSMNDTIFKKKAMERTVFWNKPKDLNINI